MDNNRIVSTGIAGLDEKIQGLRQGENVAWQIDDIADYIFVANKFVMSRIISVYDVAARDAVLYSEIESQECFLGFGK